MKDEQTIIVRDNVLPDWDYALLIYHNMFSQGDDGCPLTVNFVIEYHNAPWITGAVNWQDGIHIWQNEGLEPEVWTIGMSVALMAIKEAREIIGTQWDCAEPK